MGDKFMEILRRCLLVLVTITAASSGSAAVLNVDGGILTGATNVLVDGYVLLDVTFVEGTCAEVYGGCDDTSDFFFSSNADGARAASLALLDSVLIDSTAGNFDSEPELTRGCSFSGRCIVMTPFQIRNNSTLAEIVAADNYASTNTNVDQLGFPVRQPDAASQALDTWAVWTVSAEVPIPAAAWLFGSGLIGLLGIARRKKAA
jgi:hypothetical protein